MLSGFLGNDWRDRALAALRRAYRWGEESIPPGLRLVLGIALMAGGLLGFLPVLGFWMLPLGAILVALDVPPLRRRLRARLEGPERGDG